eukprot:14635016-Heterocapsa_arctica.AAC.1
MCSYVGPYRRVLRTNFAQGRVWGSRLVDLKRLERPSPWRQLQAEYEARQAARYAQMLQGVLVPTWTTSVILEVHIRAWEAALRRYEEATGVKMPNQIKCAIVAQHVPKGIREFSKMVTKTTWSTTSTS